MAKALIGRLHCGLRLGVQSGRPFAVQSSLTMPVRSAKPRPILIQISNTEPIPRSKIMRRGVRATSLVKLGLDKIEARVGITSF